MPLNKAGLKTNRSVVIFGIVFFAAALVINAFSNKALAQNYNIEVSPAKVNLEVEPGETYTQTFRVGNYSGSEKTLYFYTQDFTVENEEGTPLFLENADPENLSYSLTKWVKISEESLTLENEEVKEIEVEISIPDEAESGGHYAAFFTQTENPQTIDTSAIGSVGRIASLMLVNVPGDVEENIELKEFFTNKKYYFESEPKIEFTTTLANEGNVHAIPTGVIFVSGGKNFKNKNIIYNQKQGAVLPNAPDRKITESFVANTLGNLPPVGKFKANLLVKYGNQNYEINSQTEFWLLPAKFLAVVTLIALAVIFMVWRTLLSFKKRDQRNLD